MDNQLPQVDFYILSEVSTSGLLLFTCRLINKIYHLGHPIYVNTPTSTIAQDLNNLLWTFNADSFLPHTLIDDILPPIAPILIGDERNFAVKGVKLEDTLQRIYTLTTVTTIAPWEANAAPGLVLINLAPIVPEFFTKFKRVAEIVNQNEQNLQAGRTRHVFYRKHGINCLIHKIPGQFDQR